MMRAQRDVSTLRTPALYADAGLALLNCRQRAQMSREWAAKKAGVPMSTLYDWELGYSAPSPEQEAVLYHLYRRVWEAIQESTGGRRQQAAPLHRD